jgi:hypothetical protein
MTQTKRRSGIAGIRVRRRRALSLAEVTASLVIAGILLGAMGGTILVASKSLPQNNQAHSTGQTTALVLDTLAEELHCALSFGARSATAIEFTVPDRGDALVAIPALHSLEFAYDVSQRTETQKTTSSVDSPEIVLASFTGFGALLTSPLNLTLSDTQWAAASFSTRAAPAAPGSASASTPTSADRRLSTRRRSARRTSTPWSRSAAAISPLLRHSATWC